jgi:hypothetical protein
MKSKSADVHATYKPKRRMRHGGANRMVARITNDLVIPKSANPAVHGRQAAVREHRSRVTTAHNDG